MPELDVTRRLVTVSNLNLEEGLEDVISNDGG